jgi:hypothetical protein
MFPLLASWNDFAGTPMEAALEGSAAGVAYKGYMRIK